MGDFIADYFADNPDLFAFAVFADLDVGAIKWFAFV